MIAALSLALALLAPPHPIFEALKGPWVGCLEYEDYGGGGRVRIATMIRVTPKDDGRSASIRFVYDEGPNKVLEETHQVTIDPEKRTYTTKFDNESITYRVEGLDAMQADGTGVLRLYGTGTSRGKPVEVRLTLDIGATKVSMLRETRSGSDPYKFGSEFRFVRLKAL